MRIRNNPAVRSVHETQVLSNSYVITHKLRLFWDKNLGHSEYSQALILCVSAW